MVLEAFDFLQNSKRKMAETAFFVMKTLVALRKERRHLYMARVTSFTNSYHPPTRMSAASSFETCLENKMMNGLSSVARQDASTNLSNET